MNETILAIDPGTTESAYVLYKEKRLLGFDKVPNHDMLTIIANVKTSFMAIETPRCYGMVTGATLMDTSEWVGIFRHAYGLDKAYHVYRKSQNYTIGIESVCMHLCHNNRANDSNVRRAILDRYPATGGGKTPQKGTKAQPGPLFGVSKDVFSALAVAITFDETFIRCRNK